jgi:hypothetical protein
LKKQALIILFFSVFFGKVSAQQKTMYPFATKHYRDSIEEKLRFQIEEVVALPLNEATYKKYAGAYWAMELMLYRPKGYQQKVALQIPLLPAFDAGFQRAFLEMLYTLYPQQFSKEVQVIWKQLANDKVKAMALEYLAGKNIFPAIQANESFYHSDYYLPYYQRWKQKKQMPPVKDDFLQQGFLTGQIVLCSFQSSNRNKPGYLMIRDANGKWVTGKNNAPLQFPQLARSITNLPWYLTNGNTPQGLYKITGMDTSDNSWIGPTTNLQMLLPFEKGDTGFFNGDTLYATYYNKLLGPLQKYSSLKETYEAGKLGRSEIIAHGTTIDPAFYASQKYFPNTPSLGCLCSPEIWNDNGERISSVQQEWINEIKRINKLPVYLIVAEVQDL